MVFDPSFADARPSYARYWFCGMENLESITGISYLNTSEVTNMAHMFDGCSSLKALDVSGFNTSNVTDMSCMFRYCDIVDSLDVSGFNTKYVKYMDNMFYNCYLLRSLDVSGFDTRNVTDMSGMFASCGGVANFDVSGFNTAKVTNMSKMFMYCNRLRSLDLSSFNTAKVTDMEMMFQSCINLHTIYAGDGWSTAAVTSSQNMFFYCKWIEGSQGTTYNSGHVDKEYARIDGGSSDPGYFSEKPFAYAVYNNGTLTFYYDNQRDSRTGTTYDLNEGDDEPGWCADGLNTSVTRVEFDPSFADARPTSTYNWFGSMFNLVAFDGLNYLNTSEVTTMKSMFNDCSGVLTADLSSFDTRNVSDMSAMFAFCQAEVLDLSSFSTDKVTNMSGMFMFNSSLKTIYVGDMWSTSSVTSSNMMFWGCTSIKGGMGTTYDADHVDKAYAHIDGGSSNPGYFSEKPAFLLGDVNDDGAITIADVTALVNIILGKDTAGTYNHDAADVNGDSQITIADVTALVNIILGKN